MKVICISGHAQHGKDTSAKIMQKILWGYGKKVLIIHYADLLKFMCMQLFGWNGKKDENGRTLLQYVGTDVVRNQLPDFWVNYVSDVLSLFSDKWDYVLIPDCRFPNEIQVLRDNGFDVTHVKICRENYDSELTDDQLNHPSETALNNTLPDSTIYNTSTLSRLSGEVLKFIIPLYTTLEFGESAEEHMHDIT